MITNKVIELGSVVITVGGRVLGESEGLSLSILSATAEEIKTMEEAKEIILYRPQEGKPVVAPSDGVDRVPVSKERFGELLGKNFQNLYILTLSGWEVSILHGLVALAADHPEVKGLGRPTRRFIRSVRTWFKTVFLDWGFSQGEAHYLDTAKTDGKGGDLPEVKQ